MSKNKSINIKNYKRKRQLNIGIFIFAVVFIYIIVTVVMYASTKKVSTYEVREGSILKDNSYTGLAIRQETVVNAEATGYINFFQNEFSKMKTWMNAYSITSDQLSYSTETDSSAGELNKEEQKSMAVKAQSFNETYSPQKFFTAYSLKNEISNSILAASNLSKTSQIDTLLAEQHPDAQVFWTPCDGILFLHVDGLEGLTVDNFTEENFDRSNYESISRQDNAFVNVGDPAYKLITSEYWSVVIPLSEDMVKRLEEEDITVVKTRLDKDSQTIWANISVIEKDGKYYGILDYNDSLIRYARDRFLNVELILTDQSGLKIPKSSVVEKDFYQIPGEFLTKGGNTSDLGVYVKKEDEMIFTPVTIYKTDVDVETTKETSYIGTKDLPKNAVLLKPDTNDTLELKETVPLTGVYNINKGYAVFKYVKILCESDDYYIVQTGSNELGLHNYDHIVQDGRTVSEGEVVFQ